MNRRQAWTSASAVVVIGSLAALYAPAWRERADGSGPALAIQPAMQASAASAAVEMPSGAPTSSASAPDPREALRRHLAQMPRDGRGWVLLAMAEMEANRYEPAALAFGKGIEVSPKVAADPGVWCDYADALGMAQGGSLSGKPTEAIQRALSLKANHPKALEMAGSAAYERRDFAVAADHWRRLLPLLPTGSRQQQDVQAAIERATRLATTSLR